MEVEIRSDQLQYFKDVSKAQQMWFSLSLLLNYVIHLVPKCTSKSFATPSSIRAECWEARSHSLCFKRCKSSLGKGLTATGKYVKILQMEPFSS